VLQLEKDIRMNENPGTWERVLLTVESAAIKTTGQTVFPAGWSTLGNS